MTKRISLPSALLFAVCIMPATLAQVHISGELSGTLEDTTYIVEGDISVAPLESLVIEAGSYFLFDGEYEFIISGYLEAIGTEDDSIFFLPIEGVESWGTIRFTGLREDSCRLEYGYITGTSSGGVNCNAGANPVIHACTITENSATYGAAVFCALSNPRISDCLLSNNTVVTSGGAIYCSSSSPLISGCVFDGNDGGNWGGGINCYNNSSPTLIGCTFTGNTAGSTGGAINCSSSHPTITGCTISGNEATSYGGGINCYNGSEPLIQYCLVINNSAGISGGGIYSTSSNPSILNCTICNNEAFIFGGGINMFNSPDALVSQCIIHGNTGAYGVYLNDSTPWITFCDIFGNQNGPFGGDPPGWLGQTVAVNGNGDPCDVNCNIFEDPLFAGEPGPAYELQATSPCIDTGDPDAPFDPDGTIADMGAFYYDHETGGDPPPIPSTCNITGICQLEFQQDHSGTQLTFIPLSPLAERDSCYTATLGTFLAEINQGVYDVLYSHEEFHNSLVATVPVLINLNLPPVFLSPVGISGPLSGTMGPQTYIINGDVFILEEDSLTLLPGTRFLFNGPYGFDIHGYLLAAGNETDSIIFATGPDTYGWDGLCFENAASDDCLMEYCIVSGSQYCGIYCNNSSPTIRRCKITGNSTGYYEGGGITCMDHSNPVIDHCVINDNVASHSGGGISILFESNPEIINCTVFGNAASDGGGIYCESSSPLFINCIVAGNIGDGGVRMLDSPDISFEHSLFFGNGADNFQGIQIPEGLEILTTVNTYGDSCDIYFNLYTDPLLTDPDNGILTLQGQSAAINAGDADSPFDPDGTVADMGALPYTHLGSHLQVREPHHDFGPVPINTVQEWAIPMLNTGFQNLLIYSVVSDEPAFSIQPIDLIEVPPGSSLMLPVEFAPTEDILYQGIIIITSNDPESAQFAVTVDGSGEATGVDQFDQTVIPMEYSIESVYPNPFNSRLSIIVGLPEPSDLEIRLFNILGEQVALISSSKFDRGYRRITYDAGNLASGTYLVNALVRGKLNEIRQVIIVK